MTEIQVSRCWAVGYTVLIWLLTLLGSLSPRFPGAEWIMWGYALFASIAIWALHAKVAKKAEIVEMVKKGAK